MRGCWFAVLTESEAPAPGEPEGDPEKGREHIGKFAGLLAAVASDRSCAAFSTLFAYYAPKVKTLALYMGVDASTAEEVAQETLLTVWRRAGTYDPARAAASTWIYAIARNGIIDRLRRQSRPGLRPEDLAYQMRDERPLDTRIDDERATSRLRVELANLPAEQAEVVRTFYFEGKSHGRIAEELNLPLGTVKSRIRLALSRLRAAFREAP